MNVVSSDPKRARAKCIFADSRTANEDAKSANSAEQRREAYERKADLLSNLICNYEDFCIVDFDNGPGDTISVRLVDTEPSSGLHVPLCQLSRPARSALATAIDQLAA